MNETAQILATLEPGMEAKLFADPGALQMAQMGLFAFAVLCALVAVYLFAKQLGAFTMARRSFFGWIGVALAGLAAFLLFDKAQSFVILDDKEPVITVTTRELQYDTRASGWTVNWPDIENVTVHSESVTPKQSVAQTSEEVRVRLKEGAQVAWKYPDAPGTTGAKKLFEGTRYLVIDPSPLGVSHAPLAAALERYRAGR